MRQFVFCIITSLFAFILAGCGNSNDSNHSFRSDNTKGENVGLVLLWCDDGNDMIQGTAPFDLYEDNGTYYVEFYGEMCRLNRITPINIGDTELCSTFTSSKVGTYTY